MFGNLESFIRIVKDARAMANPTINTEIIDKIRELWNIDEANFAGLEEALNFQSFNKCKPIGSWTSVEDEFILRFESSLFSDSEIRAFLPENYQSILIFLPGSLTGSEEVLRDKKSQFFLKEFCRINSIALFVWDWPLQGRRKQAALYQNIQSHGILEREYARLLTMVGTSLWHEYLSELKFCLKEIQKFTDSSREITVLGWSQGGWFAYFAPLLGVKISRVISLGSCARFEDLVKTGNTHVHGFFYYPMNCMRLFDLDHAILKSALAGTNIYVLAGDKDRGCINDSICKVETTLIKNNLQNRFDAKIIPNTGHSFNNELKQQALKLVIC